MWRSNGLALVSSKCIRQPLSATYIRQQTTRDNCQRAFATQSGSPDSSSHDAIVVGVGAMGSATLYHMRKLGLKVLGLERFRVGHALGSSHGETRIIRLAYHESPMYVPLLRRSYTLWQQLQEDTQQELLTVTGGLDIAGCFQDALAAVQQHGLDHEVLTGREACQRFPGYRLPDNTPVLFQPQGGILAPEECIKAHCAEAQRLGAHLHEEEAVVSWVPDGSGVRVETTRGQYRCGTLVLTAGAWMPKLVPEMKAVCTVERQTVAWFEISDRSAFAPSTFPVFVMRLPEGDFYGFPEMGSAGFKIGKFEFNGACDPDALDRSFHASDEAALRDVVRQHFPAADGKVLKQSACMFTNTPDGHFIIDHHPLHPQVILCSACSGHGFKMSSGIGEVLATMAATGHKPSYLGDAMKLHEIQPSRPALDGLLGAFRR